MYDLIVIGGGPAGLAAALSAYENGLRKVLILERDVELGGILNQCIHSGFGLHRFKEELTGPEYAERFIDKLDGTTIEFQTDSMVLAVSADKKVSCVSPREGYQVLETKSIVLAMGCRERTRGAISIPGERPAGVFTAGTAQRYLNIEGYMVGRRVLILGSGDIGLIMARRMILEGAKVLACVELMPQSGGLTRNIVQCLEDFDIPLYLSHTVTDIRGKNRLEGLSVSKVDEKLQAIAGTEIQFDCDTLLLSVGLIPETELMHQAGIKIDPRTNGAVVYENMETDTAGIFACGNVVHVHDLVDFVSLESEKAGKSAAEFVKNGSAQNFAPLSVSEGGHKGVGSKSIEGKKKLICIVCPKGCELEIDETTLEVTGHTCPRGEEYAQNELTNPTRVVTSTVRIDSRDHERLPVKTDKPIPKNLMAKAVRLLDGIAIKAPVKVGEVVLENVLGTEINFVSTRTVLL